MNRNIPILICMVFGAALCRLLPHPDNFTPVLALSLFAGSWFSSRWMAVSVPVFALLLSDLFLGFHSLMPVVYGFCILMVYAGIFLRNTSTQHSLGRRIASTAGFSLGGSIVFFLITNFFVWLTSGFYALSATGFLQCYVLALPFLHTQVFGDLLFTGILFLSAGYLKKAGVLIPLDSPAKTF